MSLLPIFAAQSEAGGGPNGSLITLGIIAVALVIYSLVKRKGNAGENASQGEAVAPAVAASGGTPAVPRGVPAPGSLGELKLHTVPDKTAALIMAIVAEQLQVPLNELRFISIREV